MAHSHAKTHADEKLELGPGAATLSMVSFAVGVLGLVGAALYSAFVAEEGFRRFYFGYLTAFAFFMSLSMGGLFFLLVTNVTRSGWSITVRRVPEALAKVFPLFVVLALPLLWTVIEHKGQLYRWAQPDEAGHHGGEHAEAHGAVGGAEHGEAPKGPAPESGHTAAAGHEAKEAGHARVEPKKEAGERARTGEATFTHGGVPLSGNETAKSGAKSPDKPESMSYPILSPFPVDEAGKPEAPDELVQGKTHNPLLLGKAGWITRVVLSLLALTAISLWYANSSARQDKTGDESISYRLGKYSAPLLVVFGLSLTFLAFDLLMSLDPVWYSTIFGGYYFAGAAISVMAVTILVCSFLQSMGYLKSSVSNDHYHDLSKFQFAFTFFWGYLAFSQFMLLWYSSQPEALTWLARRGASTAAIHLEDFGTWTGVTIVLLFGKLLIPFAGLLSRHVKRNPVGRMFWASWILVFQLVDMYWVVMPEMNGKFVLGVPELLAVLGVGGLFLGLFVRNLAGVALRPLKDPRLDEALHFHQSF